MVACFGEAEGGAGGGEGGAESAVEVGEWDTQVDSVVFGGGLEAIGFENGLLVIVNPAVNRLLGFRWESGGLLSKGL